MSDILTIKVSWPKDMTFVTMDKALRKILQLKQVMWAIEKSEKMLDKGTLQKHGTLTLFRPSHFKANAKIFTVL